MRLCSGCFPDIVPQYFLEAHCVLIYFTVRACDMDACCVFGPGESPEAVTGRLQVQIPTQAGLVLSYGGLFT